MKRQAVRTFKVRQSRHIEQRDNGEVVHSRRAPLVGERVGLVSTTTQARSTTDRGWSAPFDTTDYKLVSLAEEQVYGVVLDDTRHHADGTSTTVAHLGTWTVVNVVDIGRGHFFEVTLRAVGGKS